MGKLNTLPSQNWDHIVQCVSGGNTMHDLQFAASPKDGENIQRGSLCSLDSNGQMVLGLSSQTAMPLWAINAAADLDVGKYNFEDGNTTSFGGQVGAWVATGGYELFTTEFDKSVTYNPNQQLTAHSTPGLVGKAAAALTNDKAVIGVVSKPAKALTEYQAGTVDTDATTTTRPGLGGAQVLYFWPCYLPQIINS